MAKGNAAYGSMDWYLNQEILESLPARAGRGRGSGKVPTNAEIQALVKSGKVSKSEGRKMVKTATVIRKLNASQRKAILRGEIDSPWIR